MEENQSEAQFKNQNSIRSQHLPAVHYEVLNNMKYSD